ncbi:MAG: imelysin family protein [Solirubrobacteraceae bacterium]|nr:imelysin family protein [Solirubrobacteraceae bacterium]
MRIRLKAVLSALLVAGLAIGGCGGGGDAAVSVQGKAAVAEHYADLAHGAYGASVASAEQMGEAIDGFLERPTQARLDAARQAWIGARDDYVVTEAFRFYGGPIDAPKTGPEGLLNAWPMDEAYVDYVEDDSDAGIVNDRGAYPRITEAVIVEGNEKGGETNISSGWHAIEFLLWGQDRSQDGPGARSARDYSTARNARRRATYLRLTTQRLVSDLRRVQAAWVPQRGGYREEFLDDPDAALTKILRGIGALNTGELAGERMAVAFESADQEDEHSCFSDNTNADVVNDLKGIRMVYTGDGPGGAAPAGASLDALLTEADPDLARELRAALAATVARAVAFPAPFERMIAAPRRSRLHRAMAETIAAIEAQGELLARAATALGVKVNFEV